MSTTTRAVDLGKAAKASTAKNKTFKEEGFDSYEIPRPASGVLKFNSFPMDVYPGKVRAFCEQLCSSIEGGLDFSFSGVALLPIASAAIGHTYQIQIKAGWCSPPVIWAGLIGSSGSGKTPMLNELWDPLAALETREFLRHESELKVWESGDKTLPLPNQPTRYTIDDTTIEAAIGVVKKNPFGLLMTKDEGAGFFDFGQYKSGGGSSERSRWLSIWGAQRVVTDRVGRQAPMAPSTFISLIAGFQPGIISRVLTAEHFESGLVARFLMAHPPEPESRWNDLEVPEELRVNYKNVMCRLLGLRDGMESPGSARIKLRPGTKAQKILAEFKDTHGRAKGELEPSLQASWQKLGEYAFRFAIILELLWWADESTDPTPPHTISERSARGAVRLVQFFANESRRLFRDLVGSADEKLEGKVLECFATHGPMTARDFDRLCPGALRGSSQKENRKRWLESLVEREILTMTAPLPGQRKERIGLAT